MSDELQGWQERLDAHAAELNSFLLLPDIVGPDDDRDGDEDEDEDLYDLKQPTPEELEAMPRLYLPIETKKYLERVSDALGDIGIRSVDVVKNVAEKKLSKESAALMVCKGVVIKVLNQGYWGNKPLLVVGRHNFTDKNIHTETFHIDPVRLATQSQTGVEGTETVAYTLDKHGKLHPCPMRDSTTGDHKGWTHVSLRNGQSACLVILQAALSMGIFPMKIMQMSRQSGDGLYVSNGAVFPTGGKAACREVPQVFWGDALDQDGLRTLMTPPATAEGQATALTVAVVLNDCPRASTEQVMRMVKHNYAALTGGIQLSKSALGTEATAILRMVHAVLNSPRPA